MSEKFLGKYRIPSARWPGWDYRNPGAYFITICTKDREHYFGEIVNGEMVLSPIGAIADVLWHEIPHHAKNVELGVFQVMPNHLHGILILKDVGNDVPGDVDTRENVDGRDNVDAQDNVGARENVDARNTVETLHATSLPTELPESPPPPAPDDMRPPNTKNEQMAAISPKAGSVSRIIGSYKGAITKHANRLAIPFDWQDLFHDHVIRNEQSFTNITVYIINNPKNWKDDKFYDR